jgi:hypothetical protein
MNEFAYYFLFAMVVVVVLISTLAFMAARFKRCPSDMILVIFGKVGQGQSARCLHGGGAFVWPLIQECKFLSLTPMTIAIPLQNALSQQNIRINVPSTFTVGISTEQSIMNNAAERLLNLMRGEIEDMAREIIFGQLRLTVASLTIEQINRLELVLGDKSRSGQQWDIWEAVYSPVGADGYPKRIWDKRTGVIDPQVAAHWRENYDLGYILRRDWNKGLGQKLEGKLSLYVGDMDNYYLNNAVYLVEEFLKGTRDPSYAGEVMYGDRAEHCSTSTGREEEPTADGRGREQRDHETGRQSDAAAEHAADARRRLVLLDDLHLAVGFAFQHRGIVRIDESDLGVQVVHRVVVGQRILEVRVHAGIGKESVNRHGESSNSGLTIRPYCLGRQPRCESSFGRCRCRSTASWKGPITI